MRSVTFYTFSTDIGRNRGQTAVVWAKDIIFRNDWHPNKMAKDRHSVPS